jgi:hypothetical protein
VPSWPRSFSPRYRWAEVPAACTQAALRKAFRRWGCPQRLRVDNGIPWGTAGGLPSELSLWLAGLGVRVHWNDPYRPQQNGVVERSQGTTRRWVDPAGCGGIEELRRRVEHEDRIQRDVYPAIDGGSRRQAYPGLLHTGRGYCEGWEKFVWDVREALRFLGRYRVRRKVSRRGQVSLYHRLTQVSPEHAGRWVYAQMDAQTVEWVISDAEGKELRRRPAPQFTAEAIVALDVARP